MKLNLKGNDIAHVTFHNEKATIYNRKYDDNLVPTSYYLKITRNNLIKIRTSSQLNTLYNDNRLKINYVQRK